MFYSDYALRQWALERLKHRQHTVVVLLREGFELVVVTAGTTKRLSEKRGRRDPQHIVKLVVTVSELLGWLIVPRA